MNKLASTVKKLLPISFTLQLLFTGAVAYIVLDIEFFRGIFNGNDNPLTANPVLFATALLIVVHVNLVLAATHTVVALRLKQPVDKKVLALAVAVLAVGLCVLLYLYNGPLGGCMALPDACGG